LSFVQRAWRLEGEKEEESVVKYKSDDMYIGRRNQQKFQKRSVNENIARKRLWRQPK